MGHVVHDTSWCVIDVDTTAGRVFLQERWQYTWLVKAGVAAWTLAERRDFHQRADRAIWAAWSNRARLRVRGASAFARRHSSVPINLDVRWVTARPHWNVTVLKIPPGTFVQSGVNWHARKIRLDTNDFSTRALCAGVPKACISTQVPVAHEFGHAAGNTAVLGRGDEYRASSPHVGDHASIMNHGNRLRSRHFRTILDEMNGMISGTTFSVEGV